MNKLAAGLIISSALAIGLTGCGSSGGTPTAAGGRTEDIVFGGQIIPQGSAGVPGSLVTSSSGIPTGAATPPGNGTGFSITHSTISQGGTLPVRLVDPPAGGQVLFSIAGAADYLRFPVPAAGSDVYDVDMSVSLDAPTGQHTLEYVSEDASGNLSQPQTAEFDIL